jgi:putative phosphoribosyl transferase
MNAPQRYRDRTHAGAVLASHFMDAAVGANPIVLGLPRGGVPVAYVVAEALGAPLDVFLVRKLGLPHQPELAMGALASGGLRLLNHALIAEAGVSRDDIDRITEEEERELERREDLYRPGLPPLRLVGQSVVVIDDGVATGFSLRAAVAALRRFDCARLCVGVPVGAPETCADLADEVDLFICPLQPEPFRAVGEWYDDFSPTSDGEVIDCLTRSVQFTASRERKSQ